MKIAEVSERFNISSDTLRYYEKVGLLNPVKRVHGIREYSEEDLNRIHFVKCMRQAGLSIESILVYLELYRQGDSTLIDRLEILLNEREKYWIEYYGSFKNGYNATLGGDGKAYILD